MIKRDYYEVLGISRSATLEEMKKAYRKLVLQYHPDRNPANPDSENQFKEIAEAYWVLSNVERRGIYDRVGFGTREQLSNKSTSGEHVRKDLNSYSSAQVYQFTEEAFRRATEETRQFVENASRAADESWERVQENFRRSLESSTVPGLNIQKGSAPKKKEAWYRKFWSR